MLSPGCAQDIIELDNLVQLDMEDRLQPASLDAEEACLERVSARIVWHVAPIIMLARSRANLPPKTRVFLHTLGLLCCSRRALVDLCDSVVSIHTDYGTEKGLSRISECPLDTFLPYLHVNEPQHLEDCETFAEDFPMFDSDLFVDEDGQEHGAGEVNDNMVSFDSVFEGPDMMHIIHNATNYLEDVVDCYAPTLASLKSICSLLAGRESKQQLIETCFQTGPGAIAFHEDIKAFKYTVHETRWNSEVNKLEVALKNHWNLPRFLGLSDGHSDLMDHELPASRTGSEEYGVNLKTVDDALCSDMFWGSLKVLLQVAMVQREAVKWVNSCPCHYKWHHATESKRMQALCDSCPLRGRRCAEIASGEFFELLESLFQTSATTLEFQLPRGLADDQVLQLMKDFEMSRRSLISTYVMKLSFWSQAPHVLAGLAHWDPRVRAHCLRRCLNSESIHPKVQFLRNNMDAVHTFLEAGGVWLDHEAVLPLRQLACDMRLMFTSAWRVEGQHARTKRAAQHASNHSAPYTSLSHRLPEIRAHLRAHPESAQELADLMGVVSNGRAAAQHLGFCKELLGKCGWISPRHFNKQKVGFGVIYHDDSYCKYTLELPERVQQRAVKVRTLTPESKTLEVEDALPFGSVELRRALALVDIRSAANSKMYFTMKFNKAMLHSVQSLLGPSGSSASAGSHCAVCRSVWFTGVGAWFCCRPSHGCKANPRYCDLVD